MRVLLCRALAAASMLAMTFSQTSAADPGAPDARRAAGEPGPVLVELFASRNCQACPKAYRTLAEAQAGRDDLLVLTWAVDYWDYLGEADPMALQDSKARQAAYVDRFGVRAPYTPQTVYDGLFECPGNRPRDVRAKLAQAKAAPADGVTLEIRQAALTVSGPETVTAGVWLVEYLPGTQAESGMPNPVTSFRQIARYNGGDLSLDRPDCAAGCAVIVQGDGSGPVLAAGQLVGP